MGLDDSLNVAPKATARESGIANEEGEVNIVDTTAQAVKLLTLAAALLVGLIGVAVADEPIRQDTALEAGRRPNVILILSDDMGYSDPPKFGKSEIPRGKTTDARILKEKTDETPGPASCDDTGNLQPPCIEVASHTRNECFDDAATAVYSKLFALRPWSTLSGARACRLPRVRLWHRWSKGSSSVTCRRIVTLQVAVSGPCCPSAAWVELAY